MFRYRIALPWLCFCLAASLGCNRGPELVEVTGKVTVKGQPVENIHVEFWPTTSGPRSMGNTDAQGRFELMTDDGKRKGAVVGNHKVVLRDHGLMGQQFVGKDLRELDGVDINEGRKSRISTDYYDPEKSPLSKEVVSGQSNQIDLEVDPGT